MAVPFSFLSRGYRESLHQKNYYSLLLLICKKEDSSALVRKYVNEVQMKKGDEFV